MRALGVVLAIALAGCAAEPLPPLLLGDAHPRPARRPKDGVNPGTVDGYITTFLASHGVTVGATSLSGFTEADTLDMVLERGSTSDIAAVFTLVTTGNTDLGLMAGNNLHIVANHQSLGRTSLDLEDGSVTATATGGAGYVSLSAGSGGELDRILIDDGSDYILFTIGNATLMTMNTSGLFTTFGEFTSGINTRATQNGITFGNTSSDDYGAILCTTSASAPTFSLKRSSGSEFASLNVLNLVGKSSNGSNQDFSLRNATLPGLNLSSDANVRWGSSATDSDSGADVGFERRAANILVLNDGSGTTAGDRTDLEMDDLTADAMTSVSSVTSSSQPRYVVVTVTSVTVNATTYLSGAQSSYYALTASGGAQTLYLPDPAVLGAGCRLVLADVADSFTSNPVTVYGFNGATISGASSYVLNTNDQTLTVVVVGSNYVVE